MRALTTDMEKQELRPYFLWDEDVSIAELHQILARPDDPGIAEELRQLANEADAELVRAVSDEPSVRPVTFTLRAA